MDRIENPTDWEVGDVVIGIGGGWEGIRGTIIFYYNGLLEIRNLYGEDVGVSPDHFKKLEGERPFECIIYKRKGDKHWGSIELDRVIAKLEGKGFYEKGTVEARLLNDEVLKSNDTIYRMHWLDDWPPDYDDSALSELGNLSSDDTVYKKRNEPGAEWKPITMEKAVRDLEGGYWKEGTTEKMLRGGVRLWTPWAYYQMKREGEELQGLTEEEQRIEDELRLEIKRHLDKCNSEALPKVFERISSKDGYRQIEDMVIRMMVKEQITPGPAIAQLESELP